MIQSEWLQCMKFIAYHKGQQNNISNNNSNKPSAQFDRNVVTFGLKTYLHVLGEHNGIYTYTKTELYRTNTKSQGLVNPRRACARGLQYLSCLSVCVCVCVCVFSLFWHLAQSGVQTAVSATSVRYGHEI